MLRKKRKQGIMYKNFGFIETFAGFSNVSLPSLVIEFCQVINKTELHHKVINETAKHTFIKLHC